MCPARFWLQFCKALDRALNFSDRVSSGQERAVTEFQACAITSWKPSSFGQKDSKWNGLFPWIISFSPKMRGQWSESIDAELCSKQLGKRASQSTEEKTRSSLLKVGEAPPPLHVKLWPVRGTSLRARSSSVLRIRSIIARLRIEVFLSSSQYMRLKSPTTVHGPAQWVRIVRNNCRKLIFASFPCAP